MFVVLVTLGALLLVGVAPVWVSESRRRRTSVLDSVGGPERMLPRHFVVLTGGIIKGNGLPSANHNKP